jgi:hypothetical protein
MRAVDAESCDLQRPNAGNHVYELAADLAETDKALGTAVKPHSFA